MSNAKREEKNQKYVCGGVKYFKLADIRIFSKKRMNWHDKESERSIGNNRRKKLFENSISPKINLFE